LGQFSAEISLEEELNEHTNVLIKIDLAEERQLSEIYAKVISFKKPQSSNLKNKIGIEFTWIPEDVKTFLNE
jgi:hypothetical protein